MNILITGGTGFVGSHLAAGLLNTGHNVAVLTRDTKTYSRIRDSRIKLIVQEEVSSFSSHTPIDVLINAAVVYGRSGETASEVLECNVIYPLRVLETMGENKPRYFINIDTFFNKICPSNYLFWYSNSKAFSFIVLKKRCQEAGIGFINIMLEQVYGQMDDHRKFAPFIFRSCVTNVPEIELTPGLQKRDFIHIFDVVDGFACILNHLKKADYSNAGTIEIGTGEAITVREFVQEVHRISASKTKLMFGALKMHKGELMESHADTSFLDSLEWKPKISLEEGISLCLNEWGAGKNG